MPCARNNLYPCRDMERASPVVEILHSQGCPNFETTLRLVRTVLDEFDLKAEVRELVVESQADATRWRFLGSPTVRINGKDIEHHAAGRADFSVACRLYEGGGVPPRELLVEGLRRALGRG